MPHNLHGVRTQELGASEFFLFTHVIQQGEELACIFLSGRVKLIVTSERLNFIKIIFTSRKPNNFPVQRDPNCLCTPPKC